MAPASGMQAWRNMSKSAYLPGHRLSQIQVEVESGGREKNRAKGTGWWAGVVAGSGGRDR